MKAVHVKTGQEPTVVDIDNTLDALQAAVGGHIEAVGWVFQDAPALYVNEEGLFGLPPNRAIYATEEDVERGVLSMDWKRLAEVGECVQILYGDFICVGFDPETGEDRDITQEEIDRVVSRFGGPRSIDSGLYEQMIVQLGLG